MTSSSLTTQDKTWLSQVSDRDLVAELLADKRSLNTRRAYERDLKDFFQVVADATPTPKLVSDFLSLDRFGAIALVLKYKAHLIDQKLAEATVNRRLAAIKSLCNYARKCGKCDYSLDDVRGEKLQSYRDTSGVDANTYKLILAVPDRTTLKGLRDYALLRLLWDNCLRRAEVSAANVEDFDATGYRLAIIGKGKGSQKQAVTLSQTTTEAILQWLEARGEVEASDPLFAALDRASYGHRLSGNSIYRLVDSLSKAAGLTKKLSPHRIRHSGITAALDATGGDVRRVQKLSRHARLETLQIYDDARQNHQGEVTDILAGLI